jgi:hypothetical protein
MGNLTFSSDSAWLTDSHWSSLRPPGKADSAASKSGSHDARSGRNTWPASNFAETTACGSPCCYWACGPDADRRARSLIRLVQAVKE